MRSFAQVSLGEPFGLVVIMMLGCSAAEPAATALQPANTGQVAEVGQSTAAVRPQDSAQPTGGVRRSASCSSSTNCANVLKSATWQQDQFPIPACWENPSADNADERAAVRYIIKNTWEAASGVRFSHWRACTSDSEGIRIQISDEGPHTKGLGIDLNGKKNGMVLNFTFENWSSAVCRSSESIRERCIESVAVHEFGHVLGFAHEQNRIDTPAWCADKEPKQGDDGDLILTPWDADSVMNYCNKGLAIWLSPLDKQAVSTLYGSPASSLVTASMLDAGTPDSGTADAGIVFDAGASVAPVMTVDKCQGHTVRTSGAYDTCINRCNLIDSRSFRIGPIHVTHPRDNGCRNSCNGMKNAAVSTGCWR